MRFTAQALHQAGETFIVAQLVVPIGTGEEHRPARNLARQKMQEAQAGVVGPLNVVDHDNQLPVLSQRFEELHQRMEQARLACLGEVRRQRQQVKQAGGHGWHQRGDLGQQDRCNLAQPRLGRGGARLRGEIDDRLVRYRALDLVAVRDQHRQGSLARITGHLKHQPALADAGLAFDQYHLTAAPREPGDQAKKLSVFVVAPDEGGLQITCRRDSIAGACDAHDLDWQRIKRQAVGSLQGAGGLQKRRPLMRGYGELLCQALRQAPGRPAFLGFDLFDGGLRTTDFLRQRVLRQIERFAPAPQPVAERVALLNHVRCLSL